MIGSVRDLFSGDGWRVSDITCRAGPHDRPFEEQHGDICIAVVTEGTFRYRASQGSAMLAPGAILLGNPGTCFECGHDHGVGDRCVSFHYTPQFMEGVLAAVPGARRLAFNKAHLAPSLRLASLVAGAEAARDGGNAAEFEEIALGLAGAAVETLTGNHKPKAASDAEERRIAKAVRRIEATAEEPLSLGDLAEGAGLSPYHFLRGFRRVAGMTPYQFVLRTRLNRAAVRLRTSSDTVSAIAFDAGFNDLSTFNRRFRRVMGQTPSAYRTRRDDAPGREMGHGNAAISAAG
jgi:AraC family transcriptional regulator